MQLKECKAKGCTQKIEITLNKCPSCRFDQRGWLMQYKLIAAILGLLLFTVSLLLLSCYTPTEF